MHSKPLGARQLASWAMQEVEAIQAYRLQAYLYGEMKLDFEFQLACYILIFDGYIT
jgi:hypothetical protein